MSVAASAYSAPAGSAEADATRLYEDHGGRVLAFCSRRVRSREDAEDAVQQTFLKAFAALRRGVTPEAEGPWLFRIAENVCRDSLRSRITRGRHESAADLDALADLLAAPTAAGDADVGTVREALALLTEPQRRALVLREWHGLSYDEIGRELSLSHSAVETLLFRARRSFARRLEAERFALRPWASDVASAVAALKSLLGAGTAKTLAAAVATAGVGAIAAPTVADELRHRLERVPVDAPAVGATREAVTSVAQARAAGMPARRGAVRLPAARPSGLEPRPAAPATKLVPSAAPTLAAAAQPSRPAEQTAPAQHAPAPASAPASTPAPVDVDAPAAPALPSVPTAVETTPLPVEKPTVELPPVELTPVQPVVEQMTEPLPALPPLLP